MFKQAPNPAKTILLILDEEGREEFFQYPKDRYEATIKLAGENINVFSNLKKENKERFVYLSDDLKDLCQSLPEEKRDRFVEMTPEEVL